MVGRSVAMLLLPEIRESVQKPFDPPTPRASRSFFKLPGQPSPRMRLTYTVQHIYFSLFLFPLRFLSLHSSTSPTLQVFFTHLCMYTKYCSILPTRYYQRNTLSGHPQEKLLVKIQNLKHRVKYSTKIVKFVFHFKSSKHPTPSRSTFLVQIDEFLLRLSWQ